MIFNQERIAKMLNKIMEEEQMEAEKIIEYRESLECEEEGIECMDCEHVDDCLEECYSEEEIL